MTQRLDAPLRVRRDVLAKPWGGGQRLGRFGVPVPLDPPTGEVWLVSDVPGRPSVVAHGPFAGRTLAQLVQDHRDDLLGRARGDRFPILVKLLEVEGKLSVQVHPDGPGARANGDGGSGKFEAWSVLDASPDARVALGLDRRLDRAEVAALVRENRLETRLNAFAPAAGEAYVIAPGTIHAAYGGLLFLEVQETADVTYRLYDWGTVGLDGRPRALHVDKALACARLEPFEPRHPGVPSPEPSGSATCRSVVSPGQGPFTFDLLELEAGRTHSVGGSSLPWVFVGLAGRAVLETAACAAFELAPGDALLWPAVLGVGSVRAASGAVTIARAAPSL